MRVILAGTPSIALPIFESVFQSDIKVLAVITNPPRSQGRSGAPVASPVSKWASERGLKVFEDGDLYALDLPLSDADLVLVVAFGRLIPSDLLSRPKNGWVNIHFSHLPEARGAAPVQRMIAAGATSIGYTLFRLEAGMDSGPVYHRSKELNIAGRTTGEVWNLLAEQAADEIVDLLHKIAKGMIPIPQEPYEGEIASAPKISSDEARISWQEQKLDVVSKILAFNPAPSAWTTFRGERFIIHRAELANERAETEIFGLIVIERSDVYVSAGNGWVRLLEVQPAGKKRMTSAEWARGVSLNAHERFE